MRFQFLQSRLGVRLIALGGSGDREFLHCGNDDPNEQVQDGEGGDDDEGDKKGPCIGVGIHDRSGDPHTPTFQSHDLKQAEEALSNRAKPFRMGVTKQVGGKDGGGIEENAHDHDDAAEPGNGMEEGGHYLSQGWDHRQ